MNAFMEGIVTIVLAIIGLAVVATLVSKNAQTGNVIQSAASGLANNIGVAESPVSGTKLSLSLGYPSGNSWASGFGG